MQNLFKISQQTIWQIIGKIVTSLSTLLILGLIARYFGKEDLGSVTLSITFVGMVMLMADFGFNGHLLRETVNQNLSEYAKSFRKLLGTRIIWSAVLVTGSLVLMPLFSFGGSDFRRLTTIGTFSVIASALFISSSYIFQKKLKYEYSSLATIIGAIAYLLFVTFIVIKKFSIIALSFSFLAGWLIIGFSSLLLLKRIIRNIYPIFDIKFSRNLIWKSWPIAAALILNVIYFRADSFMIAYYKNLSDAGVYNLAYQFFQSALVLPTFIMNSYYPIMLKSNSGYKVILLGLLGLSLIGVALVLILSPSLIRFVAGDDFGGSILSLKVLSLGFPAYFISALLMWTLISSGKYKRMFLIYLFGLIINVALNWHFIPQYSYFAAAWTTIFSEYVILSLQILAIRFR